MNLIHQTKTWLLDNNILVPDDWVSACVEWIQEEHQGVPQSQDQINSLVYEQWLLADLHELETRCLPSSAISADKFQLSGAFALQIDSILDIGQSFYSQQQKVKGTVNANVGVSAEEEQIKPWEQKPTRMLMFKLTDGSQTVQGMEYRPISCLSPQTQPGSKILIHGSILCRHGVLMLSESNLKFLGGEVDTLVEANTQLNVLESAMEASIENSGKSHRQEFEGSETRPTQKPSTNLSGQQFGGQRGNNQRMRQGGQTRGLVKQESKIKHEAPQTQPQQRTSNEFDDQWDDDQMFDALVDDMEIDDMQQPQNTNSSHRGFSNNVNAINRNGANKPKISRTAAGRCTTSIANNNTVLMDNFTSKGVKTATTTRGNNSNVKRNLNLKLEKKEVTSSNSNFENNRQDDFASLPVKRQKVTIPNNEVIDGFDDDMDFSEINEYEMIDTITDFGAQSTNIRRSNSASGSSFSDVSKNRSNISNQKQSNMALSKTKRETLKPVKSEPTVPSVKSHSGIIQSKQDVKPKVGVGIDRFFSPHKAANADAEVMETESDVVSDYPFTYLRTVLKQRPSDTKIVTVKAYISTLMSKLSSDSGRWMLSCKINDGTEACDVDLSDRVLTDLIGFSTQDAMVMKQRAKTDKSMRDTIQKGIQQCQSKLIDLMCLMELDVNSKNSKPIVVAIKQISSNDIELLYNRVRGCWNKLPT